MAFRGIQTTNLISTEVGFTDPILILNKDGSTDVDVGFLGKIGTTTYAGLVRDSTTDEFLLLSSIELSANTINDVNALDASIVKGNITVGTLTADSIDSTLSTLSDVDSVDTAATGDVLSYDGSQWGYVNLEDEINTRITASQSTQTLDGLYDVGHTSDTVANGDFLLYDSSTSQYGYVNFESEVIAYADARITAAGKLSLSGGTMTGDLIMDANEIHLADNGEIRLGNAADLVIYHNGTDSFINNTMGSLYIRGASGSHIRIQSLSGEESIVAAANGSVDLYYDNSKKFETTNTGITVTGAITASGDITAYSDDSLKTNVQVIDNAVGKVEQLRGVTFDRIEDGSTSTGVIAQELKEVLPEAVHTDEQGVHSVAYGNVVGLLIEAIKEQQKQIDELIKANKS